MSKASKKKARRQREHRKHKAISVICQRCGSLEDGSTAALLTKVADAMNACADAGIRIRVRHGIVFTSHGYVLPLNDNRWSARTVTYDPFFAPAPEGIDD